MPEPARLIARMPGLATHLHADLLSRISWIHCTHRACRNTSRSGLYSNGHLRHPSTASSSLSILERLRSFQHYTKLARAGSESTDASLESESQMARGQACWSRGPSEVSKWQCKPTLETFMSLMNHIKA
jgi:hypothetical protein